MSKLIVSQWSQLKGVAVCSFIRIGGVSLFSYDLFNFGVYCGDNSDYVEENRKRFFVAGNLFFKSVWFEQVYGKDVFKFIGEFYVLKRADVFYSNTFGTVCVVMIVDCFFVLFCNRAGTEVVVVYVGWRGLCVGVLEETVFCFVDNSENIFVWLGSVIGLRAFEVGGEVREAFMVVDVKVSVVFIQYGDKYLADIYQFVRQRLANVGVE